MQNEAAEKIIQFQRIMYQLLDPDGGCPWDLEQTHLSLRRNILEETYEVIEAIEEGDPTKLCEELGDVLLQIVFHAILAEKAGQFTLADVIDGIAEKMVRRHPHVFGEVDVADTGEVLRNWEEIKSREKGKEKRKEESALAGVPKTYPALLAALKTQEKAARVGFDWPNIDGAWQKLAEEEAELREACVENTGCEEELGDILFSVVNLARFLNIEPEGALQKTVAKFKNRFEFIEHELAAKGQKPENMALEELDMLWERSKNEINR